MLRPLCIYEYVKLIRKRPAKNRMGDDLNFDLCHPKYGEKTQVICNQKTTAILGGPLSPYQHVEDGMRGGHPETLAMRNDLARTLLPIFVPWEDLPSLFDNHGHMR